ncbi:MULTISPECIES: SapC family protein [Marinimicrobium]|uniref:SapC family protein n=1 Tax=Marinimicrobium TaxID=359337 RepID=UPI00041FEBB4|nr:SapC family protein [Marinimicrobium agarilyticum]
MPTPEILDPKKHKDLRVTTERGAQYGENIHLSPVVADELRKLVLEYAVFLAKDPDTGRFGLYALLGFEPNENLYLNGSTWNASYVPLHIRRQPFLTGTTNKTKSDTQEGPGALVAIDVDSPRVNRESGEKLFEEDGSQTAFLGEVIRTLSQMMSGQASTQVFIDQLVEQDLIEPAKLDIQFSERERRQYSGLYTIKEERLSALPDATLARWSEKGYLQASYLLCFSLGHIQRLVDQVNRGDS